MSFNYRFHILHSYMIATTSSENSPEVTFILAHRVNGKRDGVHTQVWNCIAFSPHPICLCRLYLTANSFGLPSSYPTGPCCFSNAQVYMRYRKRVEIVK